MLHLGLDIGGTKIAAAVLDGDGALLLQQRTATRKESYAQFLHDVCQLITTLQGKFNVPLSIGIALPGSISPQSGLIRNSNILPLNGQPLQQDLQQRLKQRVAIANDANCFALSEATDGAGKGHNSVFGVTLGTGCGGGQFNCVESFVSGTGLAERYKLATGRQATPQEIIARAESGEAEAVQQCARYRDRLARMLATIVNLIDPGVIVIGGGLSNAPALYQDLAPSVGAYAFTDRFCTPIVPARHGDSSGVRGAAWIGAQTSQ